MDVDSWRRIIGIAKAYGLNLLRFHSWCPPEAAFVAADELGFYFHVETCWANDSVTLGDGKPVDAWVYDETARILKAYGNHPSFLLMPYGNEPGGKKPAQGGGASQSSRPKYYDFLARYVAHFKALDSRRLWTSASGWPQIPENQFVVMPDSRIQPWGAGLTSRVNALPPETMTDYSANVASRSVPLISHEIGQWCVYPNFDEIPEYTGYLKPRNFEIFHDRLVEHHLDSHAREFLHASGKLQLMLYKEEIESQLRTPGLGGFELLALNDYPGEGTALVAVLDPFWNDKGYVTAREFSRFCNSTVLLARLQQRVFTTYQRFAANLEVANFGPEPLENAVVEWRLVDDSGRVFARGALPSKTVPIGEGFSLGRVEVGLEGASAPARLRFVVGIAGTRLENDWDVWVYPALRPPEPAGILLKSSLDDEARRCLLSGGKVLLTIPSQEVRNFERDPVKLGFSSIFWNTAWTRRQAPTTLGICCDPGHPLFRTFPTDDHSDWQWWYLIHRAAALRLDLLPAGIDPLVRVIDDWYTARPLGLIIEGTVGAGKIVVCGFDLTNDVRDPVSSQMRSSLLRYMNSDDFSPKTSLSAGMIEGLFFDSAENSGAHASE